MPSQPHIDLAYIPQHIVQRGNDGQPGFFVEADCQRFANAGLRSVTRPPCGANENWPLSQNSTHARKCTLTPVLRHGDSPVRRTSVRGFVAFTLCVASTHLLAGAPPREVAYLSAAKKIEMRMADGQLTGKMPRRTEPDAKRWLAVLSDARSVLGDAPYGEEDMGALMGVCGKANEIAVRYMLAGAERLKPLVADTAELSRKLRELTQSNSYTYQDELAGLFAFNVACEARAIVPLSARLASFKPEELTPVRREGAMQARTGLFQIISGVILGAGDAKISLDNRLLTLRALADNIRPLASALPETMRSVLAQAALAGREQIDGKLRPTLDEVVDGLTRHSACTGICAL
ncbi:MAG TPA: hypothetical protein VFG49_08915 [Dyella sp.]|uniref:hypothetical protein n=1 Tax=Dyella sp. TaxID=1869338 RepID=UPI002D7895C5|nr:hypothetical protein [Dyella sp.]HET6553645.1 hypothetical protein [Dyella sp.]